MVDTTKYAVFDTSRVINNKSISTVSWLQVTLFKGADTKQIVKHSKTAKGNAICVAVTLISSGHLLRSATPLPLDVPCIGSFSMVSFCLMCSNNIFLSAILLNFRPDPFFLHFFSYMFALTLLLSRCVQDVRVYNLLCDYQG